MLFLVFWLQHKANTIKKEQEKKFQQFLKIADRVHVFLDDVIIKEKKQIETHIVTQDYRAAALNEITGNSNYNEERITHTYCEVTFEVNYKNKKLIIEEMIPKDETSVKMYFYQQKATTLYINPNNTKQIYLDLTFMKE